jgi:hypothetical protein
MASSTYIYHLSLSFKWVIKHTTIFIAFGNCLIRAITKNIGYVL